MTKFTWAMGAVLLAGMAGNGQDQPTPRPIAAANRNEADRQEAVATYYRKAGKPRSAEYAHLAALAIRAKAPKPMRVYVPILKSDQLTRAEQLQLTELLTKGIEQVTEAKVVGSPAQADFILDATLRPVDRPKP